MGGQGGHLRSYGSASRGRPESSDSLRGRRRTLRVWAPIIPDIDIKNTLPTKDLWDPVQGLDVYCIGTILNRPFWYPSRALILFLRHFQGTLHNFSN